MKPRLFCEKLYKKFCAEIPQSGYILNPNESFLESASPFRKPTVFSACIGTGASLIMPLHYEGFTILPGEEIFIYRDWRYCNHNQSLHINVDDNIIFVHKSGNVFCVPRNDAFDHQLYISSCGGPAQITNLYHLPKVNIGPVQTYVENGGHVPLSINCTADAVYGIVTSLTFHPSHN